MTLETNYVTSLPWGSHPAGTPCKAVRVDPWRHTLEFQDGTKLEVTGRYWLKDLEDFDELWAKREGLFEVTLVRLMQEKAKADLQEQEDAKVFAILDKASQALADEEQAEVDIRES